jgi:ABC-type oligopeptide transport system substrate-binding subunit
MTQHRATLKLTAVAAALCLAACSSSGGSSSVSESKLAAKLKSEPSLQTVLNQGGTKAKIANQLVDCIAKALKKDASQSDLNKYVDGKMNLNDVGGKAKGSANKAQTDAKTCATNVVNSARSSAG